jgi:hypothetical protein
VAVFGWWALFSTAVRVVPAPTGTRTAWPVGTWDGLLTWFLTGVLVPTLLLSANLVIRVERDTVDVRFFPFAHRRIALADIASAYARTYAPIREYRGWGVKGTRRNRAYNMSGKQGVQLVLGDGTRVLLGSQRSEELAQAIQTARGD